MKFKWYKNEKNFIQENTWYIYTLLGEIDNTQYINTELAIVFTFTAFEIYRLFFPYTLYVVQTTR